MKKLTISREIEKNAPQAKGMIVRMFTVVCSNIISVRMQHIWPDTVNPVTVEFSVRFPYRWTSESEVSRPAQSPGLGPPRNRNQHISIVAVLKLFQDPVFLGKYRKFLLPNLNTSGVDDGEFFE